MELKGKIAIVTGASSGIGLATARLFGKAGAKVVLAARSKEKLIELSKEIPDSFVVQSDMSVEEEVKEMVQATVKRYGRVDILINNAGRGYASSIEDTDIKKVRELFELNLIGPLIAVQEVIPFMRKQGSGVIVNISSATSLMYLPNLGAYSSLKRALNGLSLTAREELKKDNVVVSVVYPYITKTDFQKNSMRNDNKDYFQAVGNRPNIPEGDSPELVAEKILEVIQSGDAEISVHTFPKR